MPHDNETPVVAAAKAARRAGLLVIPPREDGSKAPESAGGHWGQWRVTPPSREQYRAWYGPRTGLGIATGAASGNVEMLEFESHDTYQVFRDTADAAGLDELVARIERGYCERTPGGGYHWLYRCDEIAGNTPLARRRIVDTDGRPKIVPLIETRGEGGFAVLAPSCGRVHPSGRPYELLSGGFESIVTITTDEQRELWNLARAFNELPEDEFRPAREVGAGEVEGKPGADFNRRATWAEVLEPHGWHAVRQRGEITDWRRPGKRWGISATSNWGGHDLLYVFSSSVAPLEPGQGYSKWRVYALLNHGGDFSAAARELARSGYGDQPRGTRLRVVRSGKSTGVETPAALPDGVRLEDFRAYMPEHKYIFVPGRDLWPAASVNARLGKVIVGQDDDGNDIEVSAATWLDREQPVEQMTWAPGFDTLIPDRLISNGGWIERAGVTCFNLYHPATIELGDPDAAGPWVEHVHRVYPIAAEHIITWLAQRVQFPGTKINHALVLGGQQGIGKDTLLEPVKHAVGPWNVQEVSPVQLLGRFNSFVKSVILRVSEARDLGEVDRYAFYEHLKVYTAAPPDVLRCDEKNIREHSVLNVCGVIITTNHKTDGIYLPADDRRHFVAWSELSEADFTDDYWTRLYGWYERGGHRHVAAYLAALDLSDFNPKAPPEKTQAFWDIVDANRAPEDAELADAIDAMHNPPVTTVEQLSYRTTDNNFAEWLRDRRNRRRIPHRLEAIGYITVRNPDAADGLWKINGRRQAVYGRREMSLRDQLAAAAELTGR